jgi:hypothetical protein
MKTTAQMARARVVRATSDTADPLRPANLSIKNAERALKRQLPAVQREVRRIEAAKAVSQATLNFKFSF